MYEGILVDVAFAGFFLAKVRSYSPLLSSPLLHSSFYGLNCNADSDMVIPLVARTPVLP